MKPLVDLPLQHMQTLLRLLAEHTPQAEVWAFGSRINGTGHEGSDLDIVLRNSADLKHSTEGYFELKEAMQESSLPILIEMHDWAHIPASFHAEINRHHVVLQEPMTEVTEEAIRERLGMLGYVG
jgi:predicted nucleotidyltransferase